MLFTGGAIGFTFRGTEPETARRIFEGGTLPRGEGLYVIAIPFLILTGLALRISLAFARLERAAAEASIRCVRAREFAADEPRGGFTDTVRGEAARGGAEAAAVIAFAVTLLFTLAMRRVFMLRCEPSEVIPYRRRYAAERVRTRVRAPVKTPRMARPIPPKKDWTRRVIVLTAEGIFSIQGCYQTFPRSPCIHF